MELMRLLKCSSVNAGLILLLVASALGGNSSEDADLVRDIQDNLIAPCCWTQAISQHESGVSEEMREEVRTMVAAGMDREEILDHFVARYGERILAATEVFTNACP